MKEKINYNNIILASTSVRRIEILKNIGLLFKTEKSSYEEDMTLDMSAIDLVEYLALGKAQEVSNRFSSDLVIGADTFIMYEGKKLGKPKSEAEVYEVLEKLSGKKIEIISGVAILHQDTNYQDIFHEVTTIYMRHFGNDFIDMYIKTGIPYERAGGFGVQDIGGRIIQKIKGDYNNILGLPLYNLLDRLYEINPSLVIS